MATTPPVPIALIYRGPVVGCNGCSEAVAEILKKSKWKFDVKYVGPGEVTALSAEVLRTASLYAQPGGDGDVEKSNALVEKQLGKKDVLSKWVRGGGRYYGTCMGGFLAARPDKLYPVVSDKLWPGFDLLTGTVGQWIASPHSSVKDEKDTVVEIEWNGQSRWAFFQDGPHFNLPSDTPARVLAVYKSNKLPAVAVVSLGKGKVAVSGPHLEADHTWFAKYHIVDPGDRDGSRHHALDLAIGLIDAVME